MDIIKYVIFVKMLSFRNLFLKLCYQVEAVDWKVGPALPLQIDYTTLGPVNFRCRLKSTPRPTDT